MLNQDIRVYITDGGLGRVAAGRDWYSGMLFQDATLPAGYGTDNVKRISSIKQAETFGITVALFPVAHYHISEFFRVSQKLGSSVWIDIGFYPISTAAFDGTEIVTMQDNAGGELRQIGVFLVDPYAVGFVTGANTKAQDLDDRGFPTSVYLASDLDLTTPTDLRSLDSKWVSVVAGQDGNGVGAALFTSEGYSITDLGALLGATAHARVHERIGWVQKFDVSGITELQTLALCDGTLISTLTDAEINTLYDYGHTFLVKRRIAGSYYYADSMTAAIGTSDFTEQRLNRTIGKAKRLILEYLAPMQNSPLYVNPTTGKMTEQTIGVFNSYTRAALDILAQAEEISYDLNSGSIPVGSISIDPDQNVLATNKVSIIAKVIPVGAAGLVDVSLSFALTV